jgi:Putative Actinobacterial Holin-X, holin superfamily III
MGESAQASISRRNAIPSSGANLGAYRARERTMSEVLKDIVETVQKIVRGEVRLAKAEVRDEAAKAWKPVRYLLTGAVVGLLAAAFLLLGIVYALARREPFPGTATNPL